MFIVLLTSVCNSQVNMVAFVVGVDGAGLYQLSDSCLHSTMDASQIRDGPFNF